MPLTSPPAETAAPAADDWRALPEPWPTAFAWVEQVTGQRLVQARRQARWRPSWYLDLEGGDHPARTLYLRCQREESLPWTARLSLRREFDIMQVLEQHGVPVPALHGFCPDPEAILMDCVSGRDRFDQTDDTPTRDAVLLEYVDVLVAAQDIDPAAFEQIGVRAPATPELNGLTGFNASERWFRDVKPGADPLHEFLIRWVRRNAPSRTDIGWTHFDAGQFLHENGHLTALMDVEFAGLGDPLADLGAMRMRDTAQPIGDLTLAYAHYARATGRDVDQHVVNFHAVRFALLTSMLSAGARVDPSADFDLAQWEAWSVMAQLICLEVLAEELGVPLDDVEPITAAPSRRRPWSLSVERVLTDVLADLDPESHQAFRLRIARDLTLAIGSAEERAAALEEQDRADEETLLGFRPGDWREADAALEELVLTAGPEQDAALVTFFWRRLRRQQQVLDPAMRDVRGFRVQPVDWAQVAAVTEQRA